MYGDVGHVVVLDVPPGTEYGIDAKIYQTGPKFQGVKMIPPGIHLAYAGTGQGTRRGFFMKIGKGTVEVLKWDEQEEVLVNRALPEGARLNLEGAVKAGHMDENLAPYPQEETSLWRNLSNCITETVLTRCGLKLGEKVDPGTSEDDGDAEFSPIGDAREAHLSSTGTITPSELTQAHLDQTAQLNLMVQRYYHGDWSELLGELQLCFVLFLMLQSLHGFERWQRLVSLLCRCERAIMTQPQLFTVFLRVLHAHLKLVPSDFFVTELSKDNFLVPSLSSLLQLILEEGGSEMDPALVDGAKRLLRFLQQHFDIFQDGLELTSEDEPVVVDYNEVARVMEVEGSNVSGTTPEAIAYGPELKEKYPLLFGAMDPSREDVLMAAARLLEEGGQAGNEAEKFLTEEAARSESAVYSSLEG